jgi:superfamily I DNA/RNA helicase
MSLLGRPKLINTSDFNLDISSPWYESFKFIGRDVREYYRGILANGGNLRAHPKIHVDTIHGVKGGEADNVVICSDMSPKTYNNYIKNEDDEHRVFYVGATRAKENLHIIYPQTTLGYIP